MNLDPGPKVMMPFAASSEHRALFVRARARRHSGGAALFIVAMTLAVLASVGIYALRAAAIEVATAGYERQSMQAHNLAVYGVTAAAAAFDGSATSRGAMKAYVQQADSKLQTVSATSVPCTSIPATQRISTGQGTAPESGCLDVSSTTVMGLLQPGGTGSIGSLGPSTILGMFDVQINSHQQGPLIPGSGTMHFWYVPIVSTGRVGAVLDPANPSPVGVEVEQAVLKLMPL